MKIRFEIEVELDAEHFHGDREIVNYLKQAKTDMQITLDGYTSIRTPTSGFDTMIISRIR
jgi:hypothetical protein